MRRTVTVPWAYRAFLTVLTGDPHHIGFGKVSRLYACPEQNPQLPYRLWLIRLRDHRTPVDLFTSDDALARTVTFIH